MFELVNPHVHSDHQRQPSGILTYAFGYAYQRQAYCQALTAMATMGMKMTVVVDQLEYIQLTEVALVIELTGKWKKFEYEVTALDVTPYPITFKTDADVLFPRGSTLYHAPHLPYTSGCAVDTYGHETDTTAYREVECAAGLPKFYSACMSFDKTDPQTEELFRNLRYLFDHWYGLQLWDYTSQKLPPTTDTAYSIASLQVTGAARIDGNPFIHAKPWICDWMENEWTKFRRFQMDRRLTMYIDGIRLAYPFHYYDKQLITDSFIEELRHVCALQSR